MKIYQAWEELRMWLLTQDELTGLQPNPYSVTLDKMEELECKHE